MRKKEFQAELAEDAEEERKKTVTNSNISPTRELLTAPKRQPMIVYIQPSDLLIPFPGSYGFLEQVRKPGRVIFRL